MMNLLARFSWQKLTSVAGTFVAAFGTFGLFAIQGILLARLLGPEGRGAFATIIVYPQTFLYLGLIGAAEIFARLGSKVREGESDAPIRRSAIQYGLFSGFLTGLLCLLLGCFALPDGKRHLASLAMLAAATIPLQHMRLSVQGVDHGRGNFNRYNMVRVSAAAFFPLILFAFWFAGINDIRFATFGFLGSCVLGAFLCQWGMRESWFGDPAQSISTSLATGKGLAVSQIAAEVLDRADLLLILWLASLTDQGLYTSAIPIAATMIIIPNAIGLYSFRRGSGQQVPLSTAGVTKLLGLVFVCQLVFGAILAAILPIVVPFLYGEAFNETVKFAWYLLPAAGFRGMIMATDTYLRGRGKPKPGIAGRIFALIVLMTITFSFYTAYGLVTIPMAFGVAQFSCLLVVIFAMYSDAWQSSSKQNVAS